MINVFFFLLSVFLLMLTWRFILRAAWVLRWVILAAFIGFSVFVLIPILTSAYEYNQRPQQQAQNYAAEHNTSKSFAEAQALEHDWYKMHPEAPEPTPVPNN